MSSWAVEVTDTASAAIRAQTHWIAVEDRSPEDARRWLRALWDAVDSLERFPNRGALAEEDACVAYPVRQLVVGSHLLLYTVQEDRRRVVVVGLRRGSRLPRAEELPRDLQDEPPA